MERDLICFSDAIIRFLQGQQKHEVSYFDVLFNLVRPDIFLGDVLRSFRYLENIVFCRAFFFWLSPVFSSLFT